MLAFPIESDSQATHNYTHPIPSLGGIRKSADGTVAEVLRDPRHRVGEELGGVEYAVGAPSHLQKEKVGVPGVAHHLPEHGLVVQGHGVAGEPLGDDEVLRVHHYIKRPSLSLHLPDDVDRVEVGGPLFGARELGELLLVFRAEVRPLRADLYPLAVLFDSHYWHGLSD